MHVEQGTLRGLAATVQLPDTLAAHVLLRVKVSELPKEASTCV